MASNRAVTQRSLAAQVSWYGRPEPRLGGLGLGEGGRWRSGTGVQQRSSSAQRRSTVITAAGWQGAEGRSRRFLRLADLGTIVAKNKWAGREASWDLAPIPGWFIAAERRTAHFRRGRLDSGQLNVV